MSFSSASFVDLEQINVRSVFIEQLLEKLKKKTT